MVHEKRRQIVRKQVWAGWGKRSRVKLAQLPKYNELKFTYMVTILLQHHSKLTNKIRGHGNIWFIQGRSKYGEKVRYR
jgi:hypothetical protein